MSSPNKIYSLPDNRHIGRQWNRRTGCRLLLTSILLFMAMLHAEATPRETVKRILMIDSHTSADPWSEDLTRGFRQALNDERFKINYEVYQLGVGYQPKVQPDQLDVKALQTKLDSRRYDLIVAGDNDACELFLQKKLTIPNRTPLLLMSYHGKLGTKLRQELNMTGLLSIFHPYDNARFGLALRPELKRIYLVISADADGREQLDLLDEIPSALRSRITVLSGTDYTTEELLKQIAAMPPDSLLQFHSWSSSKEEAPESSELVLPRIRKIFPGLIIGRFDSYIPLGSNGGVVATGMEHGVQTGKLAARILRGEPAASIPLENGPTHTLLDYSAIGKFRLKTIPPGTRIVNEPPDFLIRHRVALAAGGGALILFLAAFIANLLYRRRTQKKIAVLFSHLPVRIGIFNAAGKMLYAHIPDPKEHATKDEWLLFGDLPETTKQLFLETIREVVRTRRRIEVNYEEDGTFRHDEFLLLPRGNPYPQEVVMCISSDMTEQESAHRAVVQMSERLRLTLESIGDAVIATDAEERITLLNPVASRLTAFSPEEAKGRKLDEVFNIVSYIDEKKVESPLTRAISSGRTVELANHTDLIAKDGRRYHIADSASPIRDADGKISGGVLVFRDVTAEYEKRDQLRMNSAVLNTIEQIAHIAYFRCTATGELLLPVPESYWPLRDGKPIPPDEWVSKEDLNDFLFAWRDLFRKRTDGFRITFSAGMPKRYFELQIMKSIDEISGRYEYFGVIQDISHSRENERQIHDNLQLLKNIMDNLPGYIFVKNADDNYRYVMCNRRLEEMLGIDREQILGNFDRDIFPRNEPSYLADDRAVIDSGEKRSIRESVNVAGKEPIIVQTVKDRLIQSDGTRLLIGMGIDVSREFKLEQEQKRTIESLDYATRCEQIINQSLSMITVEPNFDRAINEMLRIIGENAEADRAYIFLYLSDDCRYVSNDYEWTREGTSTQRENLQKIDMIDFPQWTKLLQDKKDVVLPDLTDPPEELREESIKLMPQGIRSLLVSGIWQDGKLLGFVGLDYTRQVHEFNDCSVHTVRSIANLFLLARERAQQVEKVAETTLLQKQIVDNISIPIAIIDTQFHFLAANPSMLKLLGTSLEELQTHQCYKTLCREQQPPPWCCLAQERSELKAHSTTIDWNDRKYIINTQPIYGRDNQIRYALKSAIDVTEITRQKIELQNAMEQVQAADRAKSYFFATMSHELRTPLNAVIGFSELLQDDNVSREEQLDYLRSINCAGGALLSLINDVLDLSKLEAAQMTLAPVKTDLNALLNEMIAVFQLKAREKNLTLDLQNERLRYPVYIDQLRMRQILLNLIGNAVKFTHRGGIAITAAFRAGKSDSTGELSIEVKDTGIGISEEQIQKIFEPFYQVEAVRGTRAYEGSGLGLAISVRLAQRMGGTIEVVSKQNQGSTFTIRLNEVRYEPGDAVMPFTGLNPLQEPLMGQRLRVLLVDDIPLNLKVLQAMLRKLNVESVCAVSGYEALNILRKDREFSCILTDLWMPGMDGGQLADAIRAIPEMKSAKVVAVTADTEAKRNFPAEKFDDILSKPITFATLQNLLERSCPAFVSRPEKES